MTTSIENRAYSLTNTERLKKDFEARGFGWLVPTRESALAQFVRDGIPSPRHENWRNTNLKPLGKVDFAAAGEVSLGEAETKQLESLAFDNPGKIQVAIVNGRFSEQHSTTGALPDGLRIESLARAMANGREAAERHLAKYASDEESPFTALNTAFMEDGVYIYAAQGVAIEEPIQVTYFSQPGGEPTVSHPRSLIVAEENSQVRVVESFAGPEDAVYLTNAVTEIVAAQHAVVDHYKIEMESDCAFHVSTLEIKQERDSKVSNHAFLWGGRLVRNDINALLDGEGIETLLSGLYLPNGQQHMDTHSKIDHAKPNCHSFELYKGIMDGQASGVFNGKILVRQDAQKTDAVQSNHSLLLSRDAQINTRPQLEIFADDVKCTHGATIGELDEDGIFYLRARGLDYHTARALMISAFATEVVDRIQCEPLRTRVQGLVEERFQRRTIGE